MTNKTKIILILVLLTLAGASIAYFTSFDNETIYVERRTETSQPQIDSQEKSSEIKNFVFTCSDNIKGSVVFNIPQKTVSVQVNQDTYNLVLGMSASGSRYVNEDESFVFWEKGGTAFIEIRGVIAHKDCVLVPKN